MRPRPQRRPSASCLKTHCSHGPMTTPSPLLSRTARPQSPSAPSTPLQMAPLLMAMLRTALPTATQQSPWLMPPQPTALVARYAAADVCDLSASLTTLADVHCRCGSCCRPLPANLLQCHETLKTLGCFQAFLLMCRRRRASATRRSRDTARRGAPTCRSRRRPLPKMRLKH